MAKNEALELVKTLRKILDTADPRYVNWDKIKREMDALIAREEARPRPIRMAPPKKDKPKKGGNRKKRDTGDLDYSTKTLM